jgi:signal transduction histidine kinase
MQNLVYPLLSLIPALLNLGIFFYLLFFVPRVKTTDIFCLFVLLLLLWQAEDTIVRLCDDVNLALFWVRILCIGWAGFAPVAFHFACRYTNLKTHYSRFSLACIYVPFVVLYLLYIATSDTNVFVYDESWKWIVTPRPGTIDELQRVLISAYVIGTILILFRYAMKKGHEKRKRLQAFIMAFGIFIPAVQGIITQIIFPVMFGKTDIPITSSTLTLFSVATLLSIRKYNLFSISESVDVKTVLTNLKNIVMVVSPQENIIYMNPYGREVFGKEDDEQELSVQSVFASPSVYNAFTVEALQPALNGTVIMDYPTLFKAGSGKKIDVLLMAELLINNKQIQGLLLVANDVTELSKTLRDLEKSNKELERFAFVASHDLQEPLRKVTAYLQRLETEYKERIDEKALSYINVAVKSGSQIRNLIQDYLEYFSITANNNEVVSVDMDEVMKEVIEMFATDIEKLRGQIVCNNLPVLHQVNAAQMRQLMKNLVSNVVKFHGDRNPCIKVGAQDLGEYWQFSIEDNGIGILPEYQEQVFIVFQRLHGKGQYPGTGIGLSISKKIVEQYGGRIWINTNEQSGCTVFFTFPKNPLPQEAYV